MFDRRKFVKDGIISAIGSMPDYWVILNADNYGKEGVLTEEDLVEIQTLINAKNNPQTIPEEDISLFEKM